MHFFLSNQSNNLRSEEASETFTLTKPLPNPTNFVQADDNSYLQWDAVANSAGYEVLVNNQVVTTNLTEYTVADGNLFKSVIRLDTTSILNSAGSYEFKVKALAKEGSYYTSNENYTTHTWTFNNKLNAPTVSVVDYNNSKHLAIFYNNLVSNYTIVSAKASLNETIEAVSVNGYVYYNLDNYFKTKDLVAGKYSIQVTANPKDSKYQSSDATTVEFVWKKQFETPTITVTQDFDADTMLIDWQDMIAQTLQGEVTPAYYQITISTTSGRVIVNKAQVNESQYVISGETLLANDSEYYFVDVCAIADIDSVMLDGYSNSVKFSYQKRLAKPKFATSVYSLTDNETINITANNLDTNANQLDILVELLNSEGGVESSKTFNGISWNYSGFEITGNSHLTDRGIYRISVRNVQNKQYATSAWSDPIYVYYAQTFEVAQDITISIDETNNVTVNFTKPTVPTLSNITAYNATVSYNNAGNKATQSIESIVGNSFSFAGDENWAAALSAKRSRITIVIVAKTTAITCAPSGLGFDTFNFAPESTTEYSFVIGAMNDPSDITMTVNGRDVTISWKGDTRYTDNTYIYSISLIDGQGQEYEYATNTSTKEQSVTLTLDEVYAIYFTIRSENGVGADKVSSFDVKKLFINTQDIASINDFDINYDGAFKATWTSVLPESSEFVGAKYILTINGTEFEIETASLEYSGKSVVLTMSAEMMAVALSSGRTATWSITTTDATYTSDKPDFTGQTVVAYRGNISVGTINNIPVVLSEAPTSLNIVGTLASWSAVTYATKYQLYVSNSEGGEVLDGRSVIVSSTSYDITNLVSGLTAGSYYIVVKVAEDTENKVYLANYVNSTSAEYLNRTPANSVTSLSILTIPAGTTFSTTITWKYTKNARFTIYLTNSSGDISYIAQNFGVGEYNLTFTEDNSQGDGSGTYTFSYLNGTNTDPTRKMIAGEYVLSVVVCGSGYFDDSAPANAVFVNKFALSRIENANLFSILPEFYLNNEDYTAELEKYENAYGFNTKFFIINDATLSYATHFNVYVLDNNTSQYVWVGKIKNEQIADSGTKLTFELLSSSENKVMLSNIIAGTNSIKIVPWGDENYYFYVQNGVDYPLAQSENELASVFNVDLYLREEAPLLNALSIDATYTDSPTNTNISEVAIVFRNAQIGSTYRVTPYYDSNYDGSTDNECASFDVPLTEDDFANGIPLGIKVFDKIRAYGPHNYYFTVQTLARNEFYLDSYVSKTDTDTKITLKTRLIEFAPYSITGSSEINSLVTEVTENNADKIAKNGSIYWTLPKHAYSIDVKYTVTLVDESQSSTMLQYEKHYKSYSAYLKIIVDASNAISYQIVADENSYFILDAENNRMIFDMRAYFEDRERIKNTNGEATGTYYLAGTYFYMIEARALGENQEPVDGVIFSPVNTFGTTTEMKPYTYQGIPYPIQPEATLSSDGILTWTFSDYIYGESAEHFGIVIRNYTDVIKPGTEQDYIQHIEYVDNVFKLDLTPWLIAGGKDRNEVFIFTVAPNSYYYNSEYVKVDTSLLQSSSTLPTIGLEWGDHREITAVLNPDISDSIYNDIVNNDYKVWIEVSLLKLSGWEVGDEMPTPGQNYDDVKQTQAYEEIVWNQSVEDSEFYNYINYQHRMTKYDFNLVSEINYLVDNLKITNVDNWLSARDSLSGGYYYIKVSLVTSSPYYSASVVTGEKMVREVWRSTADGATIEGQYLTTKTTNTAAQPIEGYDRLWGEAQFKEANLTFTVQTIEQKIDGVTYYRLPSTITVTARLYMGLDYDTDNYYTHTYNIPDPSLFGTSDIYYNEDLYPDVMISRCFIQGNEIDYSKVQVTIDIHLLFDANINAGVYHIFWVLDGDEVGDSSPINDPYKLSTEVCHYVILPTPILDYRLSYTGTNSSQYVINWILTPDKYTYTVNESCSYNINLFAFEEINGKYACDVLYDSLSPEEQKRFLDAEYQIEYFANNTNTAGKLIEYNQDYFLNGRQCYIQQPTSVNFNLVPNKNYKIFIYLSQKDWMLTGDLNDLYYLNSDTSVGVEYVYKKVSGVHSNTSIMPTIENVYPVENTVNMENNNYYTIVSDQPDLYNNAFEFYVYNTQDPVAGTDREWMKKQEEQGTYLAHWIIGTLNNAYPTGDAVEDLYILYDYQDRDPTSGRLATERSVGTLDASGHITLDQLTLSELLQNKRVQGMEEELDKVLVPINYYCRLKTWINNNEINSNAPLDDAGYYEDDVIYSKKWIRAHVPYVIDENGEINEELVDNFYNTLKEKQFTIEFLDMNVLNPSIYFVFRHNIQYAEPTVSYIEIFNKDGSSDYVNYSSLGKTDGYIIATSDSGYYYKIWLDNVYTTDPLIRNDKVIEMSLGYTFYDENDGGSSGTGSQGNEWQWTTPVRFVIHYVDDPESVDYGKAYILLAVDSQEAGASEMFTMLDERLPNYITIRLQAVTNANRIVNDGGLNTQGEYLRANSKGEVLNTKDKINRIYVDSVISYTVNDYLSVKKQYTAPEVTLMFDTMTPILSYYTENLKLLEIDGALYKTNIIESGDYVGLASNPYIYTTKKTLQDNGGQYFEYGMLKTDKRTNYLITLKYTGLDGKLYTKEITLLTYDVNRTCIVDEDGQVIGGQFYNEVNGKDTDEARFDYVNYVDIYNYVTTCLYKAMYDLINEADNTPTSSGQYHGGLIGIDIQTIAPTAEVAPANLWVTSDTRTGYEFYFYSRLETVKTNFQENLSECSFDTYSEEGMPSFYTHVGQYFYYHSYIPYHYESISRDVSYNIYLDREGNMSYDIYNSRVKDACTIRADKGKETNTWNIKNLTDILKIDLGDPSIDKANYNQWRLPESTQDRWHMNIVAVVDDSMSYVGRGFNSKDLYYIVKLKIKNDIVSLSINMGPLANQATGTVAELNTSTLLSTTNGVLYNYKTSSDSSGYTNSICLPYNAIATHARLYYYYPYKKTNSTVSRWFAIDQSQSSRYYQLLSDFINEIFVDNPEIRGSDNFKLYIQFHYEKPGDLLNSYIEDSVYSVALPFNYYRQLTFDTSKISFYQSGSSIYMSAQYSVNNQFQALKVTINQYDLNNRFVRTQISTGNSGGSIISYWARGDFSYNYADCFDTRSRSSAEIQDMISGYKTAYLGYVQGGLNQFTVTPIHDGYEKEHNLLVPGITFTQTRVNYTVLIHPSAEMGFETDYTGNPEEILSEKWQWEHDSSAAVVEKRVQYGDGWGFVSGINTSFDYMKAGSMKATWTYRFDIADSVFTKASLVGTGANLFVAKYKLMQYGDTTGSTSSTSGIPKTPPKLANYFSLTITTYCKPGFGSVFSGGGTWTVSDEVTAEPLTGTRVEYPEKYSISSFITSREVTSGSISSCSIIEGALNGGSGANRSVRASVKITCDYPEGISGFRAKVSVSANISCSGWAINGTSYMSASASGSGTIGDGTTTISCSGSKWETDFVGCKVSYGTLESGSASVSVTGRA